ncbi:radical SAM protein [Patescibacteria group bacterium]|nr:radical SAM protein [Patescibacteria group bacterium]
MSQKKYKIVIGYPPIAQEKGTPLLSQNRQFQYFNAPCYIYPMVPAYAASLAQERGYDVVWMDGIAEKMSYSEWASKFINEKPDILMIETKAPVVRQHWKIVDELKNELPELVIVLVGDHVTCFPEESLNSCSADFIILGGDYDFVLSDLADSLSSGTTLPGGIWGRSSNKKLELPKETENKGKYFVTGSSQLKHKLDDLPFIDRDLTKWKLYAYENGNYKYKPATYMYSGRDCWWNRCTFCIWDHSLYPRGSYRRFSPERLFAEVKHVVDNYGVREIFDDAGTLFVGPPLKKFCQLLIDSGYNKKVVYSCNMRLNALNQEYYDLMGKANFRFILYGMESANQETLDRIDKGMKVEDIEKGVIMAKKAGLEPHLTVMLGYPWETEEMVKNTINLARDLFKRGYVDTMQATITIPYPGTPLYNECVKNGWLRVDPKDYEAFDMRGPVMKTPFPVERIYDFTQELYSSFFTPQYIIRKVLAVRSPDDVKFLFMAARRLIGHLLDFDKEQEGSSWLNPSFWFRAVKSMFKHVFSKESK